MLNILWFSYWFPQLLCGRISKKSTKQYLIPNLIVLCYVSKFLLIWVFNNFSTSCDWKRWEIFLETSQLIMGIFRLNVQPFSNLSYYWIFHVQVGYMTWKPLLSAFFWLRFYFDRIKYWGRSKIFKRTNHKQNSRMMHSTTDTVCGIAFLVTVLWKYMTLLIYIRYLYQHLPTFTSW